MTVQFRGKSSRGIEWCDETRNATGGCMHECKWTMPDGTEAICYAKELAEHGVAKAAYPHGFQHHYWRPNALNTLASGSEDKPLLIFCDSMSDLFAANVPAKDVVANLGAMASAPFHAYQSLTKAAPQLLKYTEVMPHNLWVGVSSPPDSFMGSTLSRSQQRSMLRRSLDVLCEVKHLTDNIVWMSAEPVSWDLTDVIDKMHPLDWIVIGAASNGRDYYQPDFTHIRKLLALMDETRTPVFFKGNIRPLIDSARALGRWREDFPSQYRDGECIPAVERRQRRCLEYGWTPSVATA